MSDTWERKGRAPLGALAAAVKEFEKKFKAKTANKWADRDAFAKPELGQEHAFDSHLNDRMRLERSVELADQCETEDACDVDPQLSDREKFERMIQKSDECDVDKPDEWANFELPADFDLQKWLAEDPEQYDEWLLYHKGLGPKPVRTTASHSTMAWSRVNGVEGGDSHARRWRGAKLRGRRVRAGLALSRMQFSTFTRDMSAASSMQYAPVRVVSMIWSSGRSLARRIRRP